MKSEQRIYPRKTFRATVTILEEDGAPLCYFYTTDLSLGGVFLESEFPFALGTKLSLSLKLNPMELPLRLAAEVARLEKLASVYPGVSGLGLRFTELKPEQSARLEKFLSAPAT